MRRIRNRQRLGIMEEGIPQRLKPLFGEDLERPKAKALGYLEAETRATADLGLEGMF